MEVQVPFFDIVGIGEVYRRINPNHEDSINPLCPRVLQNVSKNGNLWELPKQSNARSRHLQ